MEAAAYKRLQAAWVSSNLGSTMEEPLLVLLPMPLMVFFACVCQPHMSGFMFEFILLVVPLTVSLTAFSYNLYILPITIILGIIVYCFISTRQVPVTLSDVLTSPPERKPPWISNLRASTNLITIVCILAVDLNIFPRKFAKTESFGFGLMDLGVGCYVVCNGLVYSLTAVKKDVWNISILGILGCIRLGGIWLTNYQENITEYGMHWNFFFTLAFTILISSVLSRWLGFSYLSLALATGSIHHAILTSGVQDWVLGATPRDTFLSANREGVASILGYVTIFYCSAAFRSYIRNDSVGILFKKTMVISAITWMATYACIDTIGISRRLCNLGYVFWISAMVATLSLVFMFVDIMLRWANNCLRVPILLSAINRNGLLFFLLGNVLTGLININIQTLLLSTLKSYCVLFSYVILLTMATYSFYQRQISVRKL